MFGVCAEKDNIIAIKWEDNSRVFYPTEVFFKEKVMEIAASGVNTLYFKDLKTWGIAIVYELNRGSYADDTEFRLVNNKAPKPKPGHYCYTLGAKTSTWFNITIGGAEKDTMLNIYAYENFVPVPEELLIKDFCGGEGDLDDIVDGMLYSVQLMRDIGCEQQTVSSSATSIWRSTYNKYDFSSLFGDIKGEEYEFIRSAYHGGWCYVNRRGKVGEGVVLDNNSLYPYVMSTCYLPIGKGKWFDGKPKDLWNRDANFGYYVRFSCRFKSKEGRVPFVRIADSNFYRYDEILTTSDIFNPATGEYEKEMIDTETGEIVPIRATLTMWKDEFLLFLEQYDVEDMEFVGGYKYNCWDKVFKTYVDRFRDMKENGRTDSERRIGKIMMNALSGNLAKNKIRDSLFFREEALEALGSFSDYQSEHHNSGRRTASNKDAHGLRRYVDLEMSEVVGQLSEMVETTSRSRSYVNLGAAITSIGMVKVVRAAQANYEHFLYSDTDSLHLDCPLSEVKGVEIDSKELGKWKVEHEFFNAAYIQPKIYYMCDKQKGEMVKWAGMRADSQRLLEECISYIKAGGDENPFIKLELHEGEHMREWEWKHLKRKVEEGEVRVRIPNNYYEMVDFRTYKKTLISRSYLVDITDFV